MSNVPFVDFAKMFRFVQRDIAISFAFFERPIVTKDREIENMVKNSNCFMVWFNWFTRKHLKLPKKTT